MRAFVIATVVVVSAVGLAAAQEVCLQNVIANHQWERGTYSSLQEAQDTLLKRYAEFKKYGHIDPARVRRGLSADRMTVFDAVTRAMFTRVRRKDLIAHFDLGRTGG